MRILVDESLPRGVKGLLEGFDVITVPERGWHSKKNGELLALAGQEFDVFLTADQNLEHQQHVQALRLAIVVLIAKTNRLEAYLPLRERLRQALGTAKPGTITRVAA